MKKGFLDGYKTYDTSQGFGNPKDWQKAFYQRMNVDEAKALLKDQPGSPYSILGVSQEATEQEIKRAFRQLMMQWHPDKNQHRVTEAEAMSKKIIAAYTVLTGS